MLAPSIVQVEPDGCYGATLTVRLHEKMWDTEQTISGFIVGIRTERSDDLPNMNHVDLEVFHPNDDVISNHLVTLHVTQLKPQTSYKFNVCCLYPQGRSSVAVSDVITTEATPVMDTYLWSRVRVKINKFVYDTMDEMQKLEGMHRTNTVEEFGASMHALQMHRSVGSSKSKVQVMSVSSADMKELIDADLILNTQTRE